MCWCLAMAFVGAILAGSQPAQARDYHKLLVVGNSITYKAPDSAISWSGNWGMAASSQNNDYVHLLHAKLQASQPSIPIDLQVAQINDENTMTGYDHLLNTGADIIVFQLGDNYKGEITVDALQKPFENMIAAIKAGANAPDVYVLSIWNDVVPNRSNSIHQAALSQGATFVDITRYNTDPNNLVTSETYCLDAWRSGAGAAVGLNPGDRGMRKIADAIYTLVPVYDLTVYEFPSSFATNPQNGWGLYYGTAITSKSPMTSPAAGKWNANGSRPSYGEYGEEFRMNANSDNSAFLTYTCPQDGLYNLDFIIKTSMQYLYVGGLKTYIEVYTSASTTPIWSRTETWYATGSKSVDLKFYPELQQLQLAAGDVITVRCRIQNVSNYDECAFQVVPSKLSSSPVAAVTFGRQLIPTRYMIPTTFNTNPQANWELRYGATPDTMRLMTNVSGSHWNAGGVRPSFGEYGGHFRFTDMTAENNNAYLVFTCPETGLYSIQYQQQTQMPSLWNSGLETFYAVYTSTSAEPVWDYALPWTYQCDYPLALWYVPELQRMALNAGDKIIIMLGMTDVNNYNEAVFYFAPPSEGAYPCIEFLPTTVVEEPVLAVTPASQNASAASGATTFAVSNAGTGDMNWTAQVITGSDWLTVNPTSGVNGGTITASFTANTGSADRTATIRITAQGATGSPIDVTVVQARQNLLVGDCDGNGKVDYADFVTLKSNFGRTGMGWAQGDFDGNNKVDYTDFVSLKANFGKTGGVSSSQMAQFQAAAEAFEAAFAPKEAAQEAQEPVQSTIPCSPLGLILMSIIGLALYSLSSLREQE